MNNARVLLATLSVRTSAKGNPYLSGRLGKANVVAFAGEPDKFGNPTWDAFLAAPEPKEASGARPGTPPHRPAARRRLTGPAASPANGRGGDPRPLPEVREPHRICKGRDHGHDDAGRARARGLRRGGARQRADHQQRLLVAGLVKLPEGYAVELGCWSTTDKGLVELPLPVVLMADGTPRVRRLVETVIAVLPLAEHDADGIAVLAQELDARGEAGEMGCTATRAADGGELFSLLWTDASGVASVPVARAESMARVLAAAERQLAELGLVSLSRNLRN